MINMQREGQFEELCRKVHYCTRCPRMEASARILSKAAGPLDAKVMFIGEAPGRLGADATEIPFHGDQAGHNFEELLASAGLTRSDVFITNAALCNPKDPSGFNATPQRVELRNCSGYLREQIDLVDPAIVVTLGATALLALRLVSRHELELATHVRSVHRWYNRKLIPLYHPGSRALIHRSMINQRSDYQFVAEQLARLERVHRPSGGTTKRSVASIAEEIVRRNGQISYFGLHKLMYLVECSAWKTLGHGITGAFFIRQKDGPYCTDLHLTKLRRALPTLRTTGDHRRPRLYMDSRGAMHMQETPLPQDLLEIIERVVTQSKKLSDAELKTKVYLTRPMRKILRAEKLRMVNMHNSPIEFDSEELAIA